MERSWLYPAILSEASALPQGNKVGQDANFAPLVEGSEIISKNALHGALARMWKVQI